MILFVESVVVVVVLKRIDGVRRSFGGGPYRVVIL